MLVQYWSIDKYWIDIQIKGRNKENNCLAQFNTDSIKALEVLKLWYFSLGHNPSNLAIHNWFQHFISMKIEVLEPK